LVDATDNMTIEDILTPADKQVVIKYALDNIKAQADERHIPGYSASFLYHGQSIMHAAISEELIVNMFSLHDKDFMKRLGSEWWSLKKISKPQPIERIRKYFGDAIGIYFSFVGEQNVHACGIQSLLTLTEFSRFHRFLHIRFGCANDSWISAIYFRRRTNDVLLLLLCRLVGCVPRNVEAKMLEKSLQLGHIIVDQHGSAETRLLWYAR
jgi:hypothetical protein